MITRGRRNLALLAPATLAVGLASIGSTLAQGTPPARAQVPPRAATAPKEDPAVRKVLTPAPGSGAAQPDAPAPRQAAADPEAARKMDDLLKRWEAKSKSVASLHVTFTRDDLDPVFNVKKTYQGQARLEKNDLVYLDFLEVKAGSTVPVFSERIVCDGRRIYQFKGETNQIFLFPLAKDEKQKALEQGALPFLFNMQADKAKERYKMSLVKEAADAYFVEIVPLMAIDKEEYGRAMIKLTKATLLPEAIKLWAPNGQETKTFTFTPGSLKQNEKSAASWFDGSGMTRQYASKGWKVIENPGADAQGQPRPVPAVGARPAASGAGRPSTKGQAGGLRQR